MDKLFYQQIRLPVSILLSMLIFNLYDPSSAFAQTLISEKSHVTFSVSNLGFRTVEGTLRGLKGTVRFNRNNLEHAMFNVSLDAASINTENKKRDEHLKNEDFFEIDVFPKISFASNQVLKTSNGYIVTGQLSMKDVSKEVKIPFNVSEEDSGLTLTGNLSIDRLDYNIGQDYGKFMVGLDVEVQIRVFLDD